MFTSAAAGEASRIAGQLQPILPTKNYGKLVGNIREYWNGTQLVNDKIRGLSKQDKAELCSDLALDLNRNGFFRQVQLLMRSARFLVGDTRTPTISLLDISKECRLVLFNNLVYSLIKTGNYGEALELASQHVTGSGYWKDYKIIQNRLIGVNAELKAELYYNLACCLAKLGRYEELKNLIQATGFWGPGTTRLANVSPASKAALFAALSCYYINSAKYTELNSLVVIPWGYIGGAKAIPDDAGSYKPLAAEILTLKPKTQST